MLRLVRSWAVGITSAEHGWFFNGLDFRAIFVTRHNGCVISQRSLHLAQRTLCRLPRLVEHTLSRTWHDTDFAEDSRPFLTSVLDRHDCHAAGIKKTKTLRNLGVFLPRHGSSHIAHSARSTTSSLIEVECTTTNTPAEGDMNQPLIAILSRLLAASRSPF